MWRIPPVGWCVTCLVACGEERPAAALWRGTGLCREHLQAVLAPDLAHAAAWRSRHEHRIPPGQEQA